MRITTKMLNQSARKAGMYGNNTSLLNYIQNNGKSNSLLKTLGYQKTAATDTKSKKNYEKLEKEADKLTEAAAPLLQNGENSLFAQAKESGDNQKLYRSVEALFEKYNSTLKALKNASGTMNDFYRQMLAEAPQEAKESLKDVGITFAKDGTASVNKDKLEAADLETLEKLFHKDSGFMGRLNFLSTRISDNAKVSERSLSNTYSSRGNYTAGNTGSKYNFWG